MIYFWCFLLFAMIVLDRLNRLAIENNIQEHQFHLYTLRDRLRSLAMQKEVNPNHWVFLYLDSSIAKTVNVLNSLTLWKVLSIAWMYHRDVRILRAKNHLYSELNKSCNKKLRDIHNEYLATLICFLIHRHTTVKLVLSKSISAIRLGVYIQRRLRSALEIQTESPITSTLQEFVPG